MRIPPKQLKSVARSVTAPARNYINSHFEMTKDEVRVLAAQVSALRVPAPQESDRAGPMFELADVIAETSLFQSRILADIRSEVAEAREQIERLSAEVAELGSLVDRVVDVVAAMNLVAEDPGVAKDS